jgi:lysophospholipase L1-like esterase
MQTILCFGDSNTWGFIPGTTAERFPYSVRMAGLLQAGLGAGFRVIEEGLSGRMSVWEDPMGLDKNGSRQLPFLLESHRPLDWISIMLGTNDLKHYMHLEAIDCALAQNALIDLIEAAKCGPRGRRPKILLIAPPLIVETPTPFGHIFDDAIPKSHGLAATYREVAEQRGCLFLDAGSLTHTSAKDGIHLDAEGHAKIAAAISEVIQRQV